MLTLLVDTPGFAPTPLRGMNSTRPHEMNRHENLLHQLPRPLPKYIVEHTRIIGFLIPLDRPMHNIVHELIDGTVASHRKYGAG